MGALPDPEFATSDGEGPQLAAVAEPAVEPSPTEPDATSRDTPGQAPPADRAARAAMLFAVAALMTCWLGPLGLVLAMAGMMMGMSGHAHLRAAGQSPKRATRAVAMSFVALVVSVFSTPVVMNVGITNTVLHNKHEIQHKLGK